MAKKPTKPPRGVKKPAPPPAPPMKIGPGNPFYSPTLVEARKQAEKEAEENLETYGGKPLYPVDTASIPDANAPFPVSQGDKLAVQVMKFEAIQRDVSSLTPKQREEIRKTIQNLAKPPKGISQTNHSDHELMHQAFRACMREKRLTFETYGKFLSPGKLSATYTKNIRIVTEFIDTTFSGISKPERLKLMMLMSRCIISYIEDMDKGRDALILDSFGFAISCASIQGIVERSFPGYLEAGMIGILLKTYQ